MAQKYFDDSICSGNKYIPKTTVELQYCFSLFVTSKYVYVHCPHVWVLKTKNEGTVGLFWGTKIFLITQKHLLDHMPHLLLSLTVCFLTNDENRILILIHNSTFKRNHEYLNFLSYNSYGRNLSIWNKTFKLITR